jgi:hypothetical protein
MAGLLVQMNFGRRRDWRTMIRTAHTVLFRNQAKDVGSAAGSQTEARSARIAGRPAEDIH